MKITDAQQKRMYALFIGLFTVSTLFTIWNIREGHKLRKIQMDLAKQELEKSKSSKK